MTPPVAPILLYDGHCGFCQGWVNWLLPRLKTDHLRLLPLQDPQAAPLLTQHRFPTDFLDSLVLIQSNQAYTQGQALRKISHYLRYSWLWASMLYICPLFLLNPFYRFVANQRRALSCENKRP